MRLIKKPTFLRTDAPHLKDLELKWKKPRGKHNKIRLGKGGKRARPKIGYANTNNLKYKINDLMPFIIKNEKDTSLIDKNKHIAIISKNLGTKKRISVIKKLLDYGIQVANIKDLELYYKAIEKTLESRKEEKKSKEQKKEKAKEETRKLQKKKEEVKEEITEEQKQDKEELEKRKILEGK